MMKVDTRDTFALVRDVSCHLSTCGSVGTNKKRKKIDLLERTPKLASIWPPEVPHNNKHGTT